ncbi:MAG: DUF885 domain-containing protein [Bacteroidia bacterium]|nr:DUF885 domain-containing protein [Bacteroidia bacterium]
MPVGFQPKKLLLMMWLPVLAAGCNLIPQRQTPGLTDTYAYMYGARDPEWLNRFSPGFQTAIDGYRQNLTAVSPTALQERVIFMQDYAARLTTADTTRWSDLLAWETLRYELRQATEGMPYVLYDFPLDPAEGIHLQIIRAFVQYHPLKTQDDCTHYLIRMQAIAPKLAGVVKLMNKRLEAGYIPPRELMEASLLQLTSLQALPPDQHPLYQLFARRISGVDPVEVNTYEAVEYLKTIEVRLRESVYPAYNSLITTLKQHLNATQGASADTAAYRWVLRGYTGEDRPLMSWQASLASQVNTCQTPILQLLDSLGLRTGPLPQRLRQASRPLAPVSAPPEARMNTLISEARARVAEAASITSGLFHEVPPVRMHIAEVPDYLQASPAWIWYTSPALDGSRQAALWLHPELVRELPAWALSAHIYAQAYPGRYLLEASWQQHKTEHPGDLMRDMPWLTGGWSLYAAWMMENDLHWYSREPYERLGYLHLMLTQAGLAVVDAGLHGGGLTPAAAQAYLHQQCGMEDEAARQAVMQVLCTPGQAVAAWMGFETLRQARQEVETRLNKQFFLPDFHQFIQQLGPVPTPVFKKALQYYIRQKMAG